MVHKSQVGPMPGFHSKSKLQRSSFGALPGQRKHIPQVDHAGNHRQSVPQSANDHTGHRGHISEHDCARHDHLAAVSLGKPPKPKHMGGVTPVHGGMAHVTRAGDLAQSVSPSQALAMAGRTEACVLDPVPSVGKTFAAPEPVVGHKSRQSGRSFDELKQLGNAILASAVKSGGHIPVKTSEK
jgi:hypothetical protein